MFYRCKAEFKIKRPLFTCAVKAGFPSPAEDHMDKALDLNEHLIQHPAATFFVRASGDSMINAGIFPGDILIVDKSLSPTHGNIVIAVIEYDFTVKRYECYANKVILRPENPTYEPIIINNDQELTIWGVVTNVIHPV